MKRSVAVVVVLIALVGASCGSKGTSSTPASGSSATTTSAASATTAGKFGSLDSPCGKDVDGKKVTVKASEAGKGTDKLYLGVANERTSQIRPGLLKEMWDSSVAFAKWCNDQGGIGGLPIELVDLDGQVLKVEQAMATACKDTFAMVGGGFVQDNLMFSGKAESDLHKCGLINIPGFVVSPQASEANATFQPLPNPAKLRPVAFYESLVKLYPEEMKKTTVVWGNLDSLKLNMQQIYGAAKFVKGFGALDPVSYDAIGTVNWDLVAQQVKDKGATAVGWVGEPANMALAVQKLREQGFTGPIFADANEYDPILISSAGAGAVTNVQIRQAFHPFEEADKWPATKQFMDILKKDGPADVKIAALGMQSFSSWLLFATSARSCAKASGGELSRECVLKAASEIHEWTGGGLHAQSDPGAKIPPACSMIMTVKNDKFERLYPKVGSKDDQGDGFSCSTLGDNGNVTIAGDFPAGNVDPNVKY